ncbi:EAL domain-containing protein [Paracoccus aminophilus]|uniref:EAL domain-containing protein n=1 Tax=Paracoccus aminophilus JCM 7686 TaxID=1367847 RepID=S5YXR2_PARAH|nr:EAL domain-containing protein [Paracoccus aminophilus]AGT09991.1 hypothetical protein JCM7686_2955 [Paracoccus aminophilus JCM 7686]
MKRILARLMGFVGRRAALLAPVETEAGLRPAKHRGREMRQWLEDLMDLPEGASLGAPAVPLYAEEYVELWFHPHRCTDTGGIIGLELEPRLNDPEIGLLGANDYLLHLDGPQLLDLTRTALSQGLTAMRQWDRAAVGVDALTLRLPDQLLAEPLLADLLLWELDRQDVPPMRLIVSVAGGAGGGSERERLGALHRLAAAGCGVEFDEFGIGGAGGIATALAKSQPQGLRRLRLGEPFLRDCDRDSDKQRMILAVMALAEHLDLEVSAAAIAAPGELAFVTQIGVAQVQGPGVAAALPLAAVAGYLIDQDRRTVLATPLRRVS